MKLISFILAALVIISFRAIATAVDTPVTGTFNQPEIGPGTTIGYNADLAFRPSLDSTSCCNLPGDANNDGKIGIGDAVYVVTYVFRGGPAPICMAEGDTNGDCRVNIGDAVYVVKYKMQGGPAPMCNDACVW